MRPRRPAATSSSSSWSASCQSVSWKRTSSSPTVFVESRSAAVAIRRAIRINSDWADGVQRSSTRWHTNCSSTTRTLEISSSERGESSATRAPRRGSRTTSPSSASRASASRTGMWLVPRSRAIARSTSRAPGAYAPSRI